MGSKRSRHASPPSGNEEIDEGQGSNAFDADRFVNLHAQTYYWNTLMNKSFIPERVLRPGRSDGLMRRQIQEHGWIGVVSTAIPAPMAVQREFYANAREVQNGTAFVRGITVPYSKEAINDVYNIATLPSDQSNWAECQRAGADLDQLIADLCVLGTVWRLKSGTTQKTSFPQTALNRYAKAWYSFICASLLPSTHHQDVTVERAVLLYGIIERKKIDLGHIVHQSIVRYMKGTTTGSIPYASLITMLCSRSGVQWDDSEPMQMPMGVIDSAAIARYVIWPGGESEPRGRGFILPEEDSGEAEEVQQDQLPPDFYARQERGMRRLNRRVDTLREEFRTWTTEFSQAMIHALEFGGTDAAFPVFGSGSTYPPPDTPSDAEDDGVDESP